MHLSLRSVGPKHRAEPGGHTQRGAVSWAWYFPTYPRESEADGRVQSLKPRLGEPSNIACLGVRWSCFPTTSLSRPLLTGFRSLSCLRGCGPQTDHESCIFAQGLPVITEMDLEHGLILPTPGTS